MDARAGDLSSTRALVAEHGIVHPQPASDWRGTFPLPPAVEAYYAQIGPVDVAVDGYGTPWFLPSLAKLWDLQAGYRWDGRTGEALAGWHDDWLVVGDHGGDPLIFDRASSAVLFAHHGEGVWEPTEWFPDLPTMAACLATLGSVARASGDEFVDDDFAVRPVHRERAVAALAGILGSRSKAETVVVGADWG